MSKATIESEKLPAYQTVAARRSLGDAQVTLDGKRARITGFLMPFAQVQSDDASIEFAWETVARVVASGGDFLSQPRKTRRQVGAERTAHKKIVLEKAKLVVDTGALNALSDDDLCVLASILGKLKGTQCQETI